jgi:hypothetical protein
MRKVIPAKAFYGLMMVLAAATFGLAFYWVITDSGIYRPIADMADSTLIGFFVSWLVLLCAQFVVTLPLRAIANVTPIDERLRDIRVPDSRFGGRSNGGI